MSDKKFLIKNAQTCIAQRKHTTIRQDILAEGEEDMTVSDGYHTMEELYEHRITLFIVLCRLLSDAYHSEDMHITPDREVWRSKRHSDGELCFGTGSQFVLGIGKKKGTQMTYHIPIERWGEADFAETLEKAPEFDGHTPADVLERLKHI